MQTGSQTLLRWKGPGTSEKVEGQECGQNEGVEGEVGPPPAATDQMGSGV